MKLTKIHSMLWADEAHTFVRIEADTNQGDNLVIGTPFSEASILWDDIKEYPQDKIGEYVALVVDNNVVDGELVPPQP